MPTAPTLTPTRLVLYETPDANALARVVNHPHIWPAQRGMYEAFHNTAVAHNGIVPVEYRRCDYGRYYVAEGGVMSATPMWSSARSALYSKTDVDIDGVQMHPCLLLHEMEKLQAADPEGCPPFDALQAMCANRDAIFADCWVDEEWLALYNAANKSVDTKKDVFKLLATLAIFGGGKSTWLNKMVPCAQAFGVEEETEAEKQARIAKWKMRPEHFRLCPAMDKYLKQIPQLARYFMIRPEYDAICQWVRDKKTEKGELDPARLPGQCLAMVLQDIETTLLLEIMQHFTSIGLPPTVYAYDGFQVKRPGSAQQEKALEDALAHVNTLRPHATFIVKPFREPVPGLDAVVPRSTAFDVDAFHQIMHDAKTEEEQWKVYARQKAYFEMSHFYVHRQAAIAQVVPSGHYKGIQSYAPDKMAQSYEHLWTLRRNDPKKIEKGEPPFVETQFFAGAQGRWRRDKTRRTMQSVELFPQPGGKPCPPGCFNLWQGWEIEHTPYDPECDISVILNHFVELIPEGACREYYLSWVAYKVQFPGLKLRTAPVLWGPQGAGKSCICEKVFLAFLGKFHYKMSDSVGDIVNRFSDNAQYLVFVLNEATMRDNGQFMEALKNAVTADVHGKEKKGVQKEFNLNNVTDYIMTTNNPNCVKVEGDADRRWFIVVTSSKYANKQPETLAYFDRLHAALDCPRHMRAFFEWLKRRDLSGFDSRKYPSSKLREAMIQSSEKPEVGFMRHFLESQTREEHEKKTAVVPYVCMYKAYVSYMSEHGFNHPMNSNQLKGVLKMVDGIEEKRSAATRGYRVTSWKQAALAVGLVTDKEDDT